MINNRALLLVVLVLALPFCTLAANATWRLSPNDALFAGVLTEVIVPALSLWGIYRFGVKPADYGLRHPLTHWKPAVFASIVFLCVLALGSKTLVYVMLVMVEHNVSYETTAEVETVSVTWKIVRATAAAFTEEIFYRGLLAYILMVDASRIRSIVFVLGSAALFAITHFELDIAGLVAMFYFGVVAAMLYLKLRNLWPLIIAHLVVNLTGG